MVLSKRERNILVTAAVAVAAYLLWWFPVGPLLDRIDAATEEIDRLTAESKDNEVLMASRDAKNRKWRDMAQSGMKADAAEAESQLMHALQDWADEVGLPPLRLNPTRPADKTLLPEIAVQVDGTGTMRGLKQILTRIKDAKFPIRVTEVKISARKEGADDLAFTLHVSTVYSPAKPAAATAPASAPTGGKP